MSNKIDPRMRERIIRNHGGGDLDSQRLLAVLEGPFSPGVLRARNQLIRALAEARTHRNRAAHTQGSADKTMHYTIFVDGRGHHLRMDAKGVVFHITDQQGTVGEVPPWVAPGAVLKPKS
jgi:hypothetical protein